MNRLKVKEIVEATGGRLLKGNPEDFVTGVKHDSRECEAGDMFVAIIGENSDGHSYIPQVADRGCRTVMVSHTEGWPEKTESELNVILVEDTEHALGDTAAFYLSRLDVKKVAVTGSVGKTSTRDFIYYVLSEKYNCVRNYKNYNNLIGLPLSVFQMDDTTEAAVLEMGMDRFGEIRRLCEIVRPETGVVTNIGVSHIERLGSREGIFRAKMEITEQLPAQEEGGTLIYAQDAEFLNRSRIEGAFGQISVGTDSDCDYVVSQVDDYGIEGIEFNLAHGGESLRVHIPLPGRHNALNGALALAVGELMGIPLEQGCEGLGKASLTGRRLRRVEGRSITVIDDTYNASPDSVRSAIDVLAGTDRDGRKVAILGDMFELGDSEETGHRAVGAHAAKAGIDLLCTVGKASRAMADEAEKMKPETMTVKHFDSVQELKDELRALIGEGDLVLVKASRGMRLEDIVEELVWI